MITFPPQLAKDALSSDDFSYLPETSSFAYIPYLIVLVTGIFSALTGSLGILGTCQESKCMLYTSAVLYAIIFLITAASLIYTCTQNPKRIVYAMKENDPTLIAGFVWIITSFLGAVLSHELGGLSCQCNQQDAPRDWNWTNERSCVITLLSGSTWINCVQYMHGITDIK